jgi:signal transduction histidine kinase
MAQAIVTVALIAGMNFFPSLRGNMLIFYCLPVYVVALYFPRRTVLGFVFMVALVAMVVRVDSIAARGLRHYFWTAFNRTGGLLFAAGCGLTFRRYREEAERRIEVLKHSQALELEVVRAAEQERQKIGHDLHDGLCQTLAALDCAAKCLKIDLETDGSPRSGLATQLQSQLSNATTEARDMARGIYSVSLSAETLPLALQDLAATMSRLFGGRIDVSGVEDISVTGPEVAVHLYRIAQEALSNALRHANASRITLTLRARDAKLVLIVSDDGCGSAVHERPGGMGWHTMRYRANFIGAQLTVTSPPGQGTIVTCEVPGDGRLPQGIGAAAAESTGRN